jgi:hypothetical protein
VQPILVQPVAAQRNGYGRPVAVTPEPVAAHGGQQGFGQYAQQGERLVRTDEGLARLFTN